MILLPPGFKIEEAAHSALGKMAGRYLEEHIQIVAEGPGADPGWCDCCLSTIQIFKCLKFSNYPKKRVLFLQLNSLGIRY